MLPTLSTNRLALRPVRPGDTDFLWQLLILPDVRRFLCDDKVLPRDVVAGIVAESLALAPGGILSEKSGAVPNISRLLVFKLGGTAKLPAPPPLARQPIDPPAFMGTQAQLTTGTYDFGRYCGGCHGDSAVGSTVLPDLRRSAVLDNAETWQAIVHDGALKDNGMAPFAVSLTKERIEAIRQYVIHRANQDKKLGGIGT